MSKLTNKANRYGRTDGRTGPNYRKVSLSKSALQISHTQSQCLKAAKQKKIPGGIRVFLHWSLQVCVLRTKCK